MDTSVRSRYFFTVGANLLRGLISFATGMLLARWLGPQAYGSLAFLLGTFIGIRQLLDMGSASAFFTFLSQRSRSKKFVRSFFVWLGLQFLIPFCIIGLLFPTEWIETVWHGEQRELVLLAFIAAFMQNSVWPVVQQAGESQRKTILVQGINVIVISAHLFAVILLCWMDMLGLLSIFIAIALEYLLASVVLQKQYNYSAVNDSNLKGDIEEPLLRKYMRYCLPLIPYAWVSFAYEFVDRWLLQKYGGGVEQAYYAVGAQFSAIALIATSSVLRIFWKEIAEAHHQGNYARTGVLYQNVSRLLFLVGAIISGFLIPWAEDLLRVILGVAYIGGATTLAIMFLYPVHQSMGQIGGTMLYATERVSLQVITGIIFMLVSMVATYFVLAPENATIPGFALASEGLAFKMVIMQLISVNVVAFIIARILSWSFDWVYQPVSLLGCMGFGWISHHVITRFPVNDWPLITLMMISGLIYLCLVAIFVYAMPWLAGITRQELVRDIQKVLNICKFRGSSRQG